MNLWNKESLSAALDAQIKTQYQASRIEFNSLNVKEGDLFIALKGARDGHEFVADALRNGASIAIVEYFPETVDRSRLIKVDSCLDALNKLAVYNRDRLKAKIIAITGSVGKTSTKEAFAQALSGFGSIFCTRGNFNNNLGLPINLASIPLDTDYVILELGMNHAGEIRELTQMLKPDIAMITKIAPAHLLYFNTVAEIAYAKSEIFEGLSDDGVAIINLDDEYFELMNAVAKEYTTNIRTFGEHQESDARITSYQFDKVEYSIDKSTICEINANIPKHHAINFAGIFACCAELGINPQKVATNLSNYKPVKGRGAVHKICYQGKNITLIDDSYNANPTSMKAALDNLASFNGSRKIAVISDMRELGNMEVEFHKEIGEYINKLNIDCVITMGVLSKNIYNALEDKKKLRYFEDKNSLQAEILSLLQDGDIVMLKGSKSTLMYEVADYILLS